MKDGDNSTLNFNRSVVNAFAKIITLETIEGWMWLQVALNSKITKELKDLQQKHT